MVEHWTDINGKIVFSPAVRLALKSVASETPVQRRRIHEWEELLKSFGVIVVNRRIVNAAKCFCNHFRYRRKRQIVNDTAPDVLENNVYVPDNLNHLLGQPNFGISGNNNLNHQVRPTQNFQNVQPSSLQNEVNMMQNNSQHNYLLKNDSNFNNNFDQYSAHFWSSRDQVSDATLN